MNMYYYIHKSSTTVLIYEDSLRPTNEVSIDYADFAKGYFIELNQDQIDWYLLNQMATPKEVYDMQFTVIVEPTLEELKDSKRTHIEKAYTKMASDNLDVQLPPLVWDGFKLGMPKCSATVLWLMQMEVERSGKIDSVLLAISESELDLININPSQPIKPFLARELFDEYLSN